MSPSTHAAGLPCWGGSQVTPMRPVTDEKGHPVMGADGRPELEEIPDISRETCMVMNELVRVISGKSDDWWKG